MPDPKDFPNPAGFSLEEEERILQKRYRDARRGKHSKERAYSTRGQLNINSMMDLMVIILVFLLMNAKEQTVQPEMSDELHMPWSTSELKVEDTMTIAITQHAVLVNNEFVVNVDQGDIPEGDRISRESPIIPDLQAKVEDVIHVQERWDRVQQDVGERVATIIADHETTYQVLTYVMMTASSAGVQKFRFAILKRGRNELWGGD
jgi:biopolymer transport protein ExbD